MALLLCTSLFALWVSPASAATNTPPPSPIKSPNPEAKGRFGERLIAAMADFNGDSINDVWVADPWATVGGQVEAGMVYLVSGASLVTTTATPTAPTVIYKISRPTPTAYEHFGFVATNIGDENGDGKPDLAVGVDAKTSTGASTGAGGVWVYSGDQGATPPNPVTTPLYTINSPTGVSGERFGSRIGKAGDIYDNVTGTFGASPPDGKAEIIVGASATASGAGKAYIFDGNPAAYTGTPPASSTAVRTFTPPNGGSFGLSVQGITNANGTSEQVISAPAATVAGNANQGQMYVYDGITGNLTLTINDPTPQVGAFFGFQDVTPDSPGDVTGDGKADIYADGWQQTVGSNPKQGQAWVFSGALTGTTSTPFYTINDPHPQSNGQFGWSMTATTTLVGTTSTPVLLIGASPHTTTTPVNNEDGGSNLFLSSSGALQTELPLPMDDQQATTATNPGPNLGWTVAAPGPLKSGSSAQTYLVGAPFWDSATNQDEGLVFTYWYDSATSRYAHAYCTPNSDGSPITPTTCT